MKFLKPTLTVLCLLFAFQAAFSQPICAFDNLHRNLLKTDSSYRKIILANEAHIREFIRKHPDNLSGNARGSAINSTLYTIPVVVHVIHTGGAIGSIYNPTDAQITGAISYLNQVYNGTYPGLEGVGDLQVQFALAARDTNCNASTGIDRIDGSSMTNYASNGVNSTTTGGVSDLTVKNFDRWDPVNYYNIWVVNKIDGKDGTSGQFIAGYAYFAGAPAAYDGTVMLATQMKTGQKTLPHEIGHALSLYHPFQGSSDAATCPANTDCTSDGDAVCDTDPITYNQTGGVVDFTCRTGLNSCTGTAYSINTERNFMNYTSCYTLFTAGQKARMQAAMSLPGRQSLVNSSALGSYPSPYAAPVAACAPATSSSGTVANNNYAGVVNVVVSNKSFSSGGSADDGGYLNKTTKCLYLIQLQKGNTYSYTISLLAANREQLAIWIDYNNDGVFNNTTERINYVADIASPGSGNYATVSGNFTIPGTATTNTTLRMRVMDEVSTAYGVGFTITGACYNPTYGQAEDYPVFLSALLPVTFDYFNGIKKENDGLLSWKTTMEENAKEFQVEKSTDGASFSSIGTVAAKNVSGGSVYSFTDKNMTAPVNYYRLRQVNNDGNGKLSEVVVIKQTDGTTPGCRVINNPFTSQLNMVFSGVRNAGATINMFDMTGRKIFSSYYKLADGQPVSIDVSKWMLKPGVYIVQAQTGNELMTQKVIKQ